ncbi:zinc ABC transporter substrate-binding protein [uncultured Shimia sp.]|uniref:zinc ABC transporter substrate-binding protein n=1 Tax=uncultured Shimia sp. TaxID=573152 RepID=UPI00262C4A91|nr:zinc ABC transporter substrate-binding protein [uncultured Shimia sp.]
MRKQLWGVVASVVCVGSAMAEDVQVIADIAPVHSIVSRVMQGAGTPELVLRPGESPHDFDLRPSTAQALQEADIVIWMGHALIPGLEKPLETLAGSSRVLDLSDVAGTTRHNFRETAVFEDHHEEPHEDHDHEDEHHDDQKNDHEGHDEAADEHDAHHHDHEGMDPHMWLDPENAAVWAVAIAETLGASDPKNAALYSENAKQFASEVHQVEGEIRAFLEPVSSEPFLVFHDAYQYFEHRFGLNAAGSLLISDASTPSAARLVEIQHAIEERNVHCVFTEPQFDPRLVKAVAGHVRSGIMDPMGVDQTVGADLYLGMLRALAQNMSDCLTD